MSKPDRPTMMMNSISEFKRLIPSSNKVLARTYIKLEDKATKAGIFVITDTDFNPAMHANRISEVVLVPEYLYYSKSKYSRTAGTNEAMDWDCDMQLKPGDIVWHSFLDGFNCQQIEVRDEPGVEYRLLDYRDIYIAKRKVRTAPNHAKVHDDLDFSSMMHDGIEYVCLNGYNLCEEVTMDESSALTGDKHPEIDFRDWSEIIDNRLGKVAFIAEPNREYFNSRSTDEGVDLKVGDVIVKKNPNIHILLEEPYHIMFPTGKLYFVIQRKDIYAKIER